jgi:hypothetical protein
MVVLPGGARAQVVVVDLCDDFGYMVELERDREHTTWVTADHMRKMPPLFLENHTGDFRDVHTGFVAYGPHTGSRVLAVCDRAGADACVCEHGELPVGRMAHWSCCGHALQEDCREQQGEGEEHNLSNSDEETTWSLTTWSCLLVNGCQPASTTSRSDGCLTLLAGGPVRVLAPSRA